MRKNTERLITGCFVMAGLFAVLAFAEWRVSKSSWESMKYVSVYYEESSAAESAAIESEKEAEYRAEATAMTFTVPYIAPTMPETSFEIASEAIVVTETEPTMPQIASESILSDFTESEVQIATEATQAVIEPYIASNAVMTAEEEQLIMRLASCEAGNQGWFGMALVMRVVLNRREAWGLSISDVIYAKGQFSVIGCDKWNGGFIAEEAPIALQAVKDGWDGSQGALFFCAPWGPSQWMRTTRTHLFTAYGHEFYK